MDSQTLVIPFLLDHLSILDQLIHPEIILIGHHIKAQIGIKETGNVQTILITSRRLTIDQMDNIHSILDQITNLLMIITVQRSEMELLHKFNLIENENVIEEITCYEK